MAAVLTREQAGRWWVAGGSLRPSPCGCKAKWWQSGLVLLVLAEGALQAATSRELQGHLATPASYRLEADTATNTHITVSPGDS